MPEDGRDGRRARNVYERLNNKFVIHECVSSRLHDIISTAIVSEDLRGLRRKSRAKLSKSLSDISNKSCNEKRKHILCSICNLAWTLLRGVGFFSTLQIITHTFMAHRPGSFFCNVSKHIPGYTMS